MTASLVIRLHIHGQSQQSGFHVAGKHRQICLTLHAVLHKLVTPVTTLSKAHSLFLSFLANQEQYLITLLLY